MTVESLKAKEIYKGNGSTTVFPVSYQYSATDTILLVFTDAKGKSIPVTSNYEIQVNPSGNTSVKYPVTGAAIPYGAKLTVYRSTPLTQIVDLIYGGAFSPEVLEGDGFDRIVMMIQEIQEQVDRSVKVPISDENPPASGEDFYADMRGFVDSASDAAARSEESALRSEDALNEMRREGQDYVDQAKAEADRAETVAEAIEGFAEAVSVVYAFSVNENAELVETRSESGDVLDMSEHKGWYVLPAQSYHSLESGSLVMNLLFQPHP